MVKEKIDWIKNHKKETAIMVLAGTGMFVLGYAVSKKVNEPKFSLFSHDIGHFARDIIVNHSNVPEASLSDIYKQIDEEIFTEIASDIEDYLCDTSRDEKVSIEKWYDTALNTHKMLKIEMDTVVGD